MITLAFALGFLMLTFLVGMILADMVSPPCQVEEGTEINHGNICLDRDREWAEENAFKEDYEGATRHHPHARYVRRMIQHDLQHRYLPSLDWNPLEEMRKEQRVAHLSRCKYFKFKHRQMVAEVILNEPLPPQL
jgi:hypothetical protein